MGFEQLQHLKKEEENGHSAHLSHSVHTKIKESQVWKSKSIKYKTPIMASSYIENKRESTLQEDTFIFTF